MRGLIRMGTFVSLLLASSVATQAQSSLGIGNAEASVAPGGPFAGVLAEILVVQREFFVGLRQALVSIRDGGGGFGWLVGLSFAYGVFHAAGPGHGKAVLSSYMLANDVALRRGIVLSFAAALVQALSAFVVVALGWFLLRGSALSMTDLAWGLELASYAMIATIGFWLLARRGGPLVYRLARYARDLATLRERPSTALAFVGRGTFTQEGDRVAPGPIRASDAYGAEICGDPAGDACDCGRSHMPDARAIGDASFSWRNGGSTVLAIGLRPCSGAIVVLTFALMNGLYGAGGASVLSMALGTATTVSFIAAAAASGRGLALLAGGSGRSGRIVRAALEIGGAVLLVLTGAGLFLASMPN